MEQNSVVISTIEYLDFLKYKEAYESEKAIVIEYQCIATKYLIPEHVINDKIKGLMEKLKDIDDRIEIRLEKVSDLGKEIDTKSSKLDAIRYFLKKLFDTSCYIDNPNDHNANIFNYRKIVKMLKRQMRLIKDEIEKQ